MARKGTFGDMDIIFAMSFIDYVREADRTKTLGDTPYNTALHSINLPAIVVLRTMNMTPVPGDPTQLWWQLGDDRLSKDSNKELKGSQFDRAVASLVYLPDDDMDVKKVIALTGLGRDRVFRPYPSLTIIPRGSHILAEGDAVLSPPWNAPKRPRLVPPLK